MGMSQEEIEALMGSEEFGVDDASKDEDSSSDDLDDLLNGVIDDTHTDTESDTDENGEDSNDVVENSNDDANDEENNEDSNDVVENINNDANDEIEDNNFDDILSGINDLVDDDEQNQSTEESKDDISLKDVAPILEKEIDEGIVPFPATKEHKVVNQLNQVAEDTEQKASQIFDVLSLILDQNDVVLNSNNDIKSFIGSQKELLEKLSSKFPNISVFSEQLETANSLEKKIDDIEQIINEENNKIFEAMELMQFHDINRQKIERVTSVLKKLTNYLNGLFEDESGKAEVKIAKHISGDNNEVVDDSELDNLINEFNKG